MLSCLLGDMHRCGGSVQVHGRIAYVPQQAWIQNATVQENIVFYNKWKPDYYEAVVRASQLVSDLEIFGTYIVQWYVLSTVTQDYLPFKCF